MISKQNLTALFFGFLGALLFTVLREAVPLARATPGQVIQASAFNLVDGSGKLRAQLGFAKEGPPGLWLMDDKGTSRLIEGLYSDGTPYLGLQDKNGQMIELMRTFGPKQTPLHIFKHEGQDMMITGLNPTNTPVPFLMTYDAARKKTVHFGSYDGP